MPKNNIDLKDAIRDVSCLRNLSSLDAKRAMDFIMKGSATDAEIAAFLVGLQMKGETIDEITGFVRSMREHTAKINIKRADLLDTCGTGGDGAQTFNISTIAAFVAAGAGVVVAKHGNKSVSSKCGSADVLARLGVNIDADLSTVKKCIENIGIGFLYAPKMHPSMRFAGPVRRQLGIRTVFNILGPLTNPLGAKRQLIGVYKKELALVFAKVLRNLGSRHVLIAHAKDGLDEISTTCSTFITELRSKKIISYEIGPKNFGIKLAKKSDLKGADAKYNADLALSILRGKAGPKADIVLLNAAAAIYASDKAGSIREGLSLAKDSIDSGSALEKLELLRKYTNK